MESVRTDSRRRRISEINRREEWVEWGRQSGHLLKSWVSQVWHDGLWESTTATALATMPTGVDKIVDMMHTDRLEDGDAIVEIGAGPGPLPQAILRKVSADIRYIVVELNPDFANLLNKIPDDRLEVVNCSGERIVELMDQRRIQAAHVLSSMPFSSNEDLTRSIISQSEEVLKDEGALTVWNFRDRSLALVEELFGEEHCRRRSAVNIPLLKIIQATKTS